MPEFKNTLMKKNRKVAFTVEVNGLKVAVCKPTMGERSLLLQAARDAGEMPEEGQTQSPVSAVRMVARVAAGLMRYPDSLELIFSDSDISELTDVDWLEELMPRLMDVFKGPSTEEATGN